MKNTAQHIASTQDTKAQKGHVFHRHNLTRYPTAVKGDGVYLVDSNGKRYLDGSSGAAVSCLGHSHPAIRSAIMEQVNKLAYAHSGFFTTEPMEELAEWLVKNAPGNTLDRVYFVSGGSEAIEASIKLARQYFLEIGQPERRYIVARWHSYHGNTLGALAAGGNKLRRAQFEPLLVEMHHISACYEYRNKQAGESSFEFGQRVANELETTIQRLGEDKVAAFIAEPVVGATIGCVPAVEGYYKRIREICDKYGVLLILDEVMCGMGRTGNLFAYEHEGIVPDILAIAKGLGAGYQPIGAMMVSAQIFNTITNGSGFFQHGHTYLGHATACAAALAVQKTIVSENLIDNVNKKGAMLRKGLEDALANHPHVGNIRGRGLFQGLEIVSNKQTKEPFDSSLKLHAKIKAAALEEGLMCYPMGGTVDGLKGDHVMFSPPFIINDSHVEEIVGSFTKALNKSLSAI
jgi:adenosylmethionine-8-amino-7-oxononanoate aminotransferase